MIPITPAHEAFDQGRRRTFHFSHAMAVEELTLDPGGSLPPRRHLLNHVQIVPLAGPKISVRLGEQLLVLGYGQVLAIPAGIWYEIQGRQHEACAFLLITVKEHLTLADVEERPRTT